MGLYDSQSGSPSFQKDEGYGSCYLLHELIDSGGVLVFSCVQAVMQL